MEVSERTYRIFVVDDHDIVREMLSAYITMEGDLQLCGEAASGEEALIGIQSVDCDLALIDVAMPGMNGIELVRRIKETRPGLRCLMLSGHAERVYVRDSLSAGAHGYVMKGDPDAILQAIRKVLEGELYLSDAVKHFGNRA